MPAPNETSLDPLHSPGSDTQEPPVLTLSAQDAGPTSRQNQAIQDAADPMVKTKRRMFSTPSLRRSATASSAAAAFAASRIKSNLSTVTKLPTALKRSNANGGSATNDDNKAHVDRVPTVPSLSRSNTESSVKKEEAKAAPRMFGIPSLMRIRTVSKEKPHSKPASDCPLDSPEGQCERSNSSSGGNDNNEAEAESNRESTTPQAQKSAINTASRFVMGMPSMLRRAVSNNHTPPSASDVPVAAQKKSPDTSANSTPRGESSEDDLEENDRHSLLMMLQVPETQRHSQIPLMAASETW